MKTYIYFGANGYNCDAYGQHAFGECSVQGTSDNSGNLSYTGEIIILPLALGAAVIIASVILFVKKARRNKRAQTPVALDKKSDD